MDEQLVFPGCNSRPQKESTMTFRLDSRTKDQFIKWSCSRCVDGSTALRMMILRLLAISPFSDPKDPAKEIQGAADSIVEYIEANDFHHHRKVHKW